MMKLLVIFAIFLLSFLMPASCAPRPETPIEAAAMRGDAPRIKELIAAGADVNTRNRRGQTPVMFAARTGNPDAIRALAEAGAQLNTIDSQNGWTPLMHAVHKRQLQSALLLIELGANVNGNARGGYTALMMAAGYGDTRFVQALLDAGADPRIESADGVTALSEAVGGVPDIDKFTSGSCQTDTVKALLQRAPDLALKKDGNGRRARLFASVGSCKDVLALVN